VLQLGFGLGRPPIELELLDPRVPERTVRIEQLRNRERARLVRHLGAADHLRGVREGARAKIAKGLPRVATRPPEAAHLGAHTGLERGREELL